MFAQERPASAQPEDAGRPAVAEALSGIPWDRILWVERRYKIEAMRFKARDESGRDWPGSDEVMVGTFDAKGETVSEEIGDIDSGDTHRFDPAKSCIVSVQPGIVVLGKTSVCAGSEPAPLGFRVEFWEKDEFPIPTGFCGWRPPLPGHHGGPYCLDDSDDDDFLGRAQIDLSPQELEAALPQVGDEYIETVVLDPCPGQLCASPFLPDYTFTYRTTRLPDVQVGLLPVLDEAMRRSGARSDLEAIVAGLRSLRAPSPRKIEPENGRNGPILSRVGPARHGAMTVRSKYVSPSDSPKVTMSQEVVAMFVLEALRQAQASGRACFPLSYAHYIETRKQSNPERRLRLAKFMLELSDGMTIASPAVVIAHEVEDEVESGCHTWLAPRGLPEALPKPDKPLSWYPAIPRSHPNRCCQIS